jgi:hypothetical protein
MELYQEWPIHLFRARSCQAGMGLGSSSGPCQEELLQLLVISHDDETYDAAAVTESHSQ